MSRKHTSIRLCVGCGERSAQRQMIRFVVDKEGKLVPRVTGGGRGAYLHCDPKCWQAFAAGKGPVRSLQRTVERPARQALVQTLAGIAKQE